MFSNVLIIYPTQLFPLEYILKYFEVGKENIILLVEDEYFFTRLPFCKMKLVLHRASMKNYFKELPHNKIYIEYTENIKDYLKEVKGNNIYYFDLIEKNLEIPKYGKSQKLPSPYFINDVSEKLLHQSEFYKIQRKKLNILMEGDNPIGNKWSYDTENRGKFSKDYIENAPVVSKDIEEALKYVLEKFPDNYGECNAKDFIYPINRKDALTMLNKFVKEKLEYFGKYQDSISGKITFGYHSLLSSSLNIGLLIPSDIITEFLKAPASVPISSLEGYIRQVIGWREYCYYTYKNYSDTLESSSLFKGTGKIPDKIWLGETQIPMVDDTIKKVSQYGYSHHIERLMIMGNFFILIGLSPVEMYKWFSIMYIDAYDVFMIPNVFGMLCYGKLDKIHMMHHPYLSNSNYILKMSDYKGQNEVVLGSEVYKWTEIYDALYWKCISDYTVEFKKIYYTAYAVSRWNKFDKNKQDNFLNLAKKYLKWFYSKN